MAGSPIIYLTNATLVMRLATAPPPGVAYAGEVSSAAVVPTAGDETSVVTLDYIRHSRYGPPSYALALTVQQSWIVGSLCKFLWENKGQLVSFALTLTAQSAIGSGNPGFIGNALAVPAQFGGEAETWIEGEVEMPIDGEPTLWNTTPTQEMWDELAERAKSSDLMVYQYANPGYAPAAEREPQGEPEPAAV